MTVLETVRPSYYTGAGPSTAELDDIVDTLERLADGRGMTPSAVQRAARISDIGGAHVHRAEAMLDRLVALGRAHKVGRRYWPGRAADWTGPDAPEADNELDDFRQARDAGDF